MAESNAFTRQIALYAFLALASAFVPPPASADECAGLNLSLTNPDGSPHCGLSGGDSGAGSFCGGGNCGVGGSANTLYTCACINGPKGLKCIKASSTVCTPSCIQSTSASQRDHCSQSGNSPPSPPPFVMSPCSGIAAGFPGKCSSLESLGMAVYQTRPGIGYNADGSMSIFIRDENGYLQYTSQTAPGATTWNSTWQNLYGSLNGDPVVITRNGGFEVFYIGLDEAVWHIRQNGAQWGYHTIIGGAAGGQVTVAYDPKADKVQLFYKGDDQSLMTIVENGGAWGQPVAMLPANSVTSNIASIDANGNRYLFYRAIDGTLTSVTLIPGSTTGSNPVSLSKPWAVTSNIALATDATGNIHAFYRGPDNALWDYSPSVGRAVSLGGRGSGDPVVCTLPGKLIRVYWRATDGGVDYIQQDKTSATGWGMHKHTLGQSASAPNTSGATLLSQTIFSNIAIGIDPDGRQETFYVGSDSAIWHLWETAASSSATPYPNWSPQASIGGDAARGNSLIAKAITGSQPIAAYAAPDAATIFYIIGRVPYSSSCAANPSPHIGFYHPVPNCNGVSDNVYPITPAMGIALLEDDIQSAIDAVKASNTGSATQAQFDALVKAQLVKMGIL
jgi:hypothetical protein